MPDKQYQVCLPKSGATLQHLCQPLSLAEWRMEAHKWFDRLWSYSPLPKEARTYAYCSLAEHLDLPVEQTHIALFNVEQCKETVKWAKKNVRAGRSKSDERD